MNNNQNPISLKAAIKSTVASLRTQLKEQIEQMDQGQQKGDASVYSHENKKFKSFIKTAEKKLTTLGQFSKAQDFQGDNSHLIASYHTLESKFLFERDLQAFYQVYSQQLGFPPDFFTSMVRCFQGGEKSYKVGMEQNLKQRNLEIEAGDEDSKHLQVIENVIYADQQNAFFPNKRDKAIQQIGKLIDIQLIQQIGLHSSCNPRPETFFNSINKSDKTGRLYLGVDGLVQAVLFVDCRFKILQLEDFKYQIEGIDDAFYVHDRIVVKKSHLTKIRKAILDAKNGQLEAIKAQCNQILEKYETQMFEQVVEEEENKESFENIIVGKGVDYPLTLQKIMSQLVNKAIVITLTRFHQVLRGFAGVSNLAKVQNDGESEADLKFNYTVLNQTLGITLRPKLSNKDTLKRLNDVAYEIILDRQVPGLGDDFNLYSDVIRVKLQDAKSINHWDIRQILQYKIKQSYSAFLQKQLFELISDTTELLYYPYCTVQSKDDNSFNFSIQAYEVIRLDFRELKIYEAVSVSDSTSLLTKTEMNVFNSMLEEAVTQMNTNKELHARQEQRVKQTIGAQISLIIQMVIKNVMMAYLAKVAEQQDGTKCINATPRDSFFEQKWLRNGGVRPTVTNRGNFELLQLLFPVTFNKENLKNLCAIQHSYNSVLNICLNHRALMMTANQTNAKEPQGRQNYMYDINPSNYFVRYIEIKLESASLDEETEPQDDEELRTESNSQPLGQNEFNSILTLLGNTIPESKVQTEDFLSMKISATLKEYWFFRDEEITIEAYDLSNQI